MKKKIVLGICFALVAWIFYMTGYFSSPTTALEGQITQYKELNIRQATAFEKLCGIIETQNRSIAILGGENPDPPHCASSTFPVLSD